ncbi:MAG: hypothetical protein R3B90_00775 [Planctomycetaceae bacterium]
MPAELPRCSRRDFAATLATGGLAALTAVTPVKLSAKDQAGGAGAEVADEPAGVAGNSVKGNESTSDLRPELEDLLLAAASMRHPSQRMTPERLSGIRAGLRRNRLNSDILRTVPLGNHDEPATIFRASPLIQ